MEGNSLIQKDERFSKQALKAQLPAVKGVPEYIEANKMVVKALTKHLKKVKEEVALEEEKEKDITALAKRNFSLLNNAIEEKIQKLMNEHQINMKFKSTEKEQRKVKGRSTSDLKKRQESPAKQIEEKEVMEESEEITPHKEVCLSQLKTKRNKIQLQIYSCFLCMKQKKEEWIWQDEDYYLDHMRTLHKLDPQFQLVLFSLNRTLSFSHAFFKGKLTNLLLNFTGQQYIKIYYLIKKKRYHQLYYCSCSSTDQHNYKSKFSITQNQQKYFNHLIIHHFRSKVQQTRILPKYSHHIKKVGSQLILAENPEFDYENVPALYNHHIKLLPTLITGQISSLKLLKAQPLNQLELVSCGVIKKYLNFARYICFRCRIIFTNSFQSSAHWKVCDQSESYCQLDKQEMFYKFSLMFAKLNIGKYIREGELTRKEREAIDAQTWLCQRQFLRCQQCVCGVCHQIFTKDRAGYMLHIYLEHEQLWPNNSHSFSFLTKNFIDINNK